jgi:hypothetical protein
MNILTDFWQAVSTALLSFLTHFQLKGSIHSCRWSLESAVFCCVWWLCFFIPSFRIWYTYVRVLRVCVSVWICVCVCVCVRVWNMKAVLQCLYKTGVIRNIRRVAYLEGFYRRKTVSVTQRVPAAFPRQFRAATFCQGCREALNTRILLYGTEYAK